MASFFLDYGYKQQGELRFPAKKLKALWFSPPSGLPHEDAATGGGVNGPLPRIFISELLVDQLSPQAQVSGADSWYFIASLIILIHPLLGRLMS